MQTLYFFLSFSVLIVSILLLTYPSWCKRSKKINLIAELPNTDHLNIKPKTERDKELSDSDDSLIIISIMAKNNSNFASYDLIQAISAAGLQYGDMNIFHYFYPDANFGIKLFSLISAEEPGEFNLDNIGNFSCSGLMLFMEKTKVPDPISAFNIMLEKAQQLADDLEGQLCSSPKIPWNMEVEHSIKNRLKLQCIANAAVL